MGHFGCLLGNKFQPCHRADHNGAVQLRQQAPGHTGDPCGGAADIELVRADIRPGLGIVGPLRLGAGQLQAGGKFHAAIVGAALEQIDIAQKAIDKGAGRVVPNLLRGADLFDLALVDDDHAVGHFQRFFLVVGDKDAGHMQLIVQAAQPAAQLFAHLGIQSAKGFIQQQHLRLHGQGAGQGDALALAARQLGRKALGHPVQLHQREQLHHPGADLRLAGALFFGLHAQAKGHVVKHGHVLEQGVVLKHKTHAALAHMHPCGVLPGKVDAAAVRRFQPGDDAQQRGLAAARRPQQSHQFARGDVQIDIAQGVKIAKAFVDVAYFNAHF